MDKWLWSRTKVDDVLDFQMNVSIDTSSKSYVRKKEIIIPFRQKLKLLHLSMLAYSRLNQISENIMTYGTSKVELNPALREKSQICDSMLQQNDPLAQKLKTQKFDWRFYPNSPFYFCWTFITVIFLLYYITLMPYFIVFYTDLTPIHIFEMTSDVFFLVDILVNFNLCYLKKNGNYETNLKKIVVRYLKYYFILDLATSFPFNWIFVDQNYTTIINKLLRVLKLPKIVSTLKHSSTFSLAFILKTLNLGETRRFKIKARSGLINTCYVLFLAYIIVHCSACVFLLIGQYSDDTYSWYITYKIADMSNMEAYVTSLYFCLVSLTTVGFGDINPQNIFERLFVIFWMLFGIAFFSFMISFINFFFTSVDNRKTLLEKKYLQLENFKKDNDIKDDLVDKICNSLEYSSQHFAYRWVEPEHNVVTNLPIEIQNSLLKTLHPLLIRSPFFNTQDPSFLVKIVPALSPCLIKKGEFLWNKNEKACFVAFILSGSIALMEENVFAKRMNSEKYKALAKRMRFSRRISEPKKTVKSKNNGNELEVPLGLHRTERKSFLQITQVNNLGELLLCKTLAFNAYSDGSYIGEEEVICDSNRKFYAKALVDTDVMLLSHFDFERIVRNEYPHHYSQLQTKAKSKERYNLTKRDAMLHAILKNIKSVDPSFKIDIYEVIDKLKRESANQDDNDAKILPLNEIYCKVNEKNIIETIVSNTAETTKHEASVCEEPSSPGLNKMHSDWKRKLISNESQTNYKKISV